MVTAGTRRHLILPPDDRAYWLAPADKVEPLLYLGWGARQFGAAPIPAQLHDGWTIALVEAGSPFLVFDSHRQRLGPLMLLLFGPDRAFGWQDDLAQTCRLLSAVWARLEHPDLAKLPANVFLQYSVTTAQLDEFVRLHGFCRSEVQRLDRHSIGFLSAVQALIETLIVRVAGGEKVDSSSEFITHALNWIQAHLTTRQPLSRLSDFLGVSPATVQRIFQERLGTSVIKTIAELRCREADRMLSQEGTSIKEVAYRLGYRHPHDFSRAYQKHTGRTPRPHH